MDLDSETYNQEKFLPSFHDINDRERQFNQKNQNLVYKRTCKHDILKKYYLIIRSVPHKINYA